MPRVGIGKNGEKRGCLGRAEKKRDTEDNTDRLLIYKDGFAPACCLSRRGWSQFFFGRRSGNPRHPSHPHLTSGRLFTCTPCTSLLFFWHVSNSSKSSIKRATGPQPARWISSSGTRFYRKLTHFLGNRPIVATPSRRGTL